MRFQSVGTMLGHAILSQQKHPEITTGAMFWNFCTNRMDGI